MHLLDTKFEDERGIIVNLVAGDEQGQIGGVQLIRSNAGTVRANHWHRTDWHVLHIVSGFVRYHERRVNDAADPHVEGFGPGSTIYTGPLVEHALEFTDDTVMVSISGRRRGEDEHDAVPLEKSLVQTHESHGPTVKKCGFYQYDAGGV